MTRPKTSYSFCFGFMIAASVALWPGFGPGAIVGEGGAAYAQTRVQRAPAPAQRVIQAIPNLEVQKHSKEFIEWGSELTIYAPRELQFRWGYPVTSASARWDLVDAPFPGGNVLLSGTINASPGPTNWNHFKIDLRGALPASAPIRQTNKYYVRIFPQGGNLAASHVVTITYKTNDQTTTFAGNTVFPKLEIIEVSEVFPTGQESLANVDVTLRVTNTSNKPSDPLWLKIADSQALFLQSAPVEMPELAPGVWIARQVRLKAIMPPPPNVTPGGAQQLREWNARYEKQCGPVFRGLMDWRGPQNQMPVDSHRDIYLPMEGWADYSTLAPSVPVCRGNQCVNLCEMKKAIHKRLDGNVVGYAFVIGGQSPRAPAAPGSAPVLSIGPAGSPAITRAPATTIGPATQPQRNAGAIAPRFGAGGFARTAANAPAIKFTSKTKLNGASISKMITAIATLRVLEEQNVQLFSGMIGPYFPSDWDVDPYFQSLNFAQLLAQQSGIRKYGSSNMHYDALKELFEGEVDPAAPASAPCIGWDDPDGGFLVSQNAAMSTDRDERYCYSNYNTGIMRLLLPRLAGLPEHPNPAMRAQTLAQQYENLVRDKVFKPVGVSDVGCRPMPGNNSDAYSYIYPGNSSGNSYGDFRLGCGAANWTVSVEDMAKVLFSINARDEKILTEKAYSSQASDPLMPGALSGKSKASQFDAMRQFALGLDISGDTMMEKNGGYNGTTDDGRSTTIVSTTAAIFGPYDEPNVIGVLFLNSNVKEQPPDATGSAVITRAPSGTITINPGAIITAQPTLTIGPKPLPSASARSILQNAYDDNNVP